MCQTGTIVSAKTHIRILWPDLESVGAGQEDAGAYDRYIPQMKTVLSVVKVAMKNAAE